MSAQAETVTIEPKATSSPIGVWWRVVDRAMDTAGDYLNPILVKETRQALKSRQFTITFALLLFCGWLWSIIGVALMPSIWYGSQGMEMFFGYYIILAFPLLVIVPYGAFRSLAGEREDRTYELMSITALGPRQIIRGKLGSAFLQMLVYLSAISPCLAFTYMLRGIDFPTILFILGYTVLASLSLSVVGLLIGTLTTEKHWQVVLSVLMVAALLLSLYMAIGMTSMMLFWQEIPFDDVEFWIVCAAWLTGHLSYFMLVYYAAAAQITFAADNRSTRLRVVMLVQHILFVGWMAWTWIWMANGEEEVLLVFMILLGIHWWVMGALMTGESPDLSPRAKRKLPQSFLGRIFFTWFNPGPGTGYLFAISSLIGGLIVAMAGLASVEAFGAFNSRWNSNYASTIIAFGILGLSYITIYLGLGLLVVRLFRRFTYVGVLLTALTHILLLMIGCGIPAIIHMMSSDLRHLDYSLLQIPSPLWTLPYIADRSGLPPEAPLLLAVVPLAALIVFALNLPGVAAEVRHVRLAKPRRVADEDAELSAELAPPAPVRTSPWD
ncbi:MAG: hypothetical protein V3R99_10225 [Thermoguttaceae bacterium]